MRMQKGQQFKLVELDNAIVILRPEDNVGRQDARAELIIGDMPTCAEYLVRYQEFRAAGLSIRDAHQRALYGANVVSPGTLDLPEDLKVTQ